MWESNHGFPRFKIVGLPRGILGKHCLDAGWGQFFSILEQCCFKRGIYNSKKFIVERQVKLAPTVLKLVKKTCQSVFMFGLIAAIKQTEMLQPHKSSSKERMQPLGRGSSAC
jgi:hypothetical protein